MSEHDAAADAELPTWVDRAVLQELLEKIPAEGRRPLLEFLAKQLGNLDSDDAAIAMSVPGNKELSQLLARLLKR